jgi:hypothetical protein
MYRSITMRSGGEPSRRLDRVRTVAHLAAHLPVFGGQLAPERGAEFCVVVDDQDSG